MTVIWILVWIMIDAPASEDIPWWMWILLGAVVIIDMMKPSKS